MKLFLWQDAEAPSLILKEDGSVIGFYDYPHLWNFEVGDQIQYQTKLGVTVFVVEKVEPANMVDYPSTMQLVTARKKA